MTDIVKVWKRVTGLAKIGTAGYDDQNSFNEKINQVQAELVEMLTDVYEINKKASDALAPFIIELPTTTDAAGILPNKPAGFLHLCTIMYTPTVDGVVKHYPTKKIGTNEVAMVESSPVRSPKLVNNEAVYYFSENKIKMLPRSAFNVNMIYCTKPSDASIVLTPTQSQNSDYLTPTVGVNLQWPDSMFNMIVYLTLEKLGVEMKEQILAEFSSLGINREMIKTNPQ